MPRPVARTDLQLGVPGPHLAELAHHFYEAALDGEVAKALEYSLRAGEYAERLLATEEASAHCERAQRLLEASASADGAMAEALEGLRERIGA